VVGWYRLLVEEGLLVVDFVELVGVA